MILLISEIKKYNRVEHQTVEPMINISSISEFKQNCIKSLSKVLDGYSGNKKRGNSKSSNI